MATVLEPLLTSTSSPRVGASPPRAGMRPSIQSSALPVYENLRNPDGSLDVAQLSSMLSQLDISLPSEDYMQVVNTVAGNVKQLTQEQTMAIVGFIQSSASLASSSSTASMGGANAAGSRAPLRKVLTKNRSYLETGSLSYDEAVVSYLFKLDEHRKKCEADGRYQEARAAALRLADLKTAQVERLRQELVVNQHKEIEEVHRVFEEESAKFSEMWDARVKEYEANFHKAVEDIRLLQEEQRRHYVEELLRKKPFKPKPSREYLNQKKIEGSLAKSQQYMQAVKVKEAADELFAAEVASTQQAYEAEQKLRIAKYTTKQKQEFEALLQRGARGRDELELRRIAETERRLFRFRNVIAELENLHRLEVVQLENFLDAQVQAGKAVPLKDEGAFRRKREVLYNTQF